MPLDPNIILGAKSPQFDLAQFSPMNTMMSAMKLRQLEQEGSLNALTLGERRGVQDFMATKPDLQSTEARTALASRFGETGRKVASSLTGISAADTAGIESLSIVGIKGRSTPARVGKSRYPARIDHANASVRGM